MMRAEDLESSTASIIEATCLAETAAVLRGCAVPGLAEFNDAALAVFRFGDLAADGADSRAADRRRCARRRAE